MEHSVHPFIAERLAALPRHDFETVASGHRLRNALLEPAPSWRVRAGTTLIRFGTWLAKHPTSQA